jgi:hypothetical protein
LLTLLKLFLAEHLRKWLALASSCFLTIFCGVPVRNVLAEGLAESGDFVRVAASVLPWATRLPTILRHIAAFTPDILALEELNHYGPQRRRVNGSRKGARVQFC